MIDISVHELNKHYGSNHVIKGITFEINSGEKIGLLGKNGSGKTTLFKIIAEDETYDSGSVSKASGKKVEILAQIPIFAESDTVEDILRSSFKEITEIYEAMKKIEGDGNPTVLKRYGKLMEEYERLGGYDVEVKIEKICNGMNIGEGMRESPFRLLSGGEKTRVNLARILLRDCDILLLDEPTNHLDLTSLEWLENFLREFMGTVAVISHDRSFLDNVITRVIEIDDGKAHFYSGNYSWYAEEKRRRFVRQSELYERHKKEIKRIEDRARWFVEQNRFTTKHHAILSRIDHMEKVEKPGTSMKITEEFNSGGHAAKVIVSLDSVYKAYGANILLDNVTASIARNDRIALIGANGCGKTTLIKLIMGEESCGEGTVKVSSNVKIAYMPQIIRFDDDGMTVLETLRDAVGLPEVKIRSILAKFKFMAADVLKKVGNLSGGEKSRLKLCLLMQTKANFLILDEPTNHLDIESREWIEDAVSDWGATMLFISHDRYFLNKFASKVWSMKDGGITEFDGAFDGYLKLAAGAGNHPNKPIAGKKKKTLPAKAAEQPKKPISYETLIYEAEAELSKVSEEIEAFLSDSNYQEIKKLYQKKHHIEEQIASLYDEWSTV
ncbi:MAG: ATP-binding cassette domain-containing protein [Defluviitaleaceae bacterium]|nr:ATP-binding cassette domain-containing protein [Defluviitaleaceae bacterium]MCL2836225.1 ATP-binding cassette domain-containing protein [Defluviitaleaceae bacterium]